MLKASLHMIGWTLRGALDELCPAVVDDAELPGAAEWQPDTPRDYCPRCGASTGPGAVTHLGCAFCVDERFAWQRLTRLSAYAEPMDEWVRRMKFRGQWSRGPWLGARLAQAVGEPMDAARVVVCAVPMHWTRRWRRGYNQAALIAEALAKARGWEVAPVLHRHRRTPPQTSVSPSARPANVRGAFRVDAVDLSGYEVVLVDDVKTTGATLQACARLLREAGARGVHAAVAAVADPRGQGFGVL